MKIQKTLSNLDENPSNYSFKSNTNEGRGIKGLFDSDIQITVLNV